MNADDIWAFGPGPPGYLPRRCPWCQQARWVLMGGGVWWCTGCDGAVPLPGPKGPRP